MYKNGQNNFDVLLKASAETPTAEKDTIDAATINKATDEEASVDSSKSEKPLQFFLNKLQLKNIAFTLNDQTIVKPFSYKVSDISVTGSNINFDTPCALHIGAAFPDGGTLSVKYKGAISNTSTMDLYVGVKNLSLKHFTPYTYHYTGYPISSGTLAFASDNKLVNDDIESRNTIDIYNIDVADKDPSASPEFNVPMKLGLYILKDKNDKIQFDVPIKGNLNDPEFSYFKIIWKTISNLLVKVALSPLKVVSGMAATGASAVGLDLGKSDEILFDPLNQNMESEQYAKAAKVVESIAKDPNLRISFVQNFPLKKTLEAYKIRKLKTDFYKALHGKTSLNELDEKSSISMDDSDSTYTAYAAEHEASLDIKSLEKELLDMASRRSQELQKTLLQQKGISSKNVTVKTASKGELARFRGKAAFKINLDVK